MDFITLWKHMQEGLPLLANFQLEIVWEYRELFIEGIKMTLAATVVAIVFGTLIGLVRMFTAMQDPTAIGPAMAVALLATLYGALFANLIAMPIAGRLRRLARAEAFERARIEAPLAALAACEPTRRTGIAA